VISIDSASRIRGAFAAVAALILAIAIMRVRTAMRPFRAAEVALPLSSRRRLRALCTASLAVAFPLIAAGLAAPFAFVLLLALVLLGEHFALRARRGEWQLNVIGAWAAVIAAINIVAATIAAIGLLLYAWQRAVAADRTCDAPVVTEPE
jgi:hypothetical protein